MKSEENNGSDFELIKLVDVCRSYGFGDAESFALKNFSMSVKRGEFIMIMGPSGCGKTTLLNVLGLLDKPTSGSYFLNGKKVNRLTSRGKSHIRAKKIGFIFQDFNLIPNLTVIENVALPLVYSGANKTHRLIQASDTLQRFHLSEREYFLPSQLSGGQKQRVAIARSLVAKPEIILADEPTGNLDSRSSHIVMEELRRIHSEGNTIIMVTHNPNLTTYATRVIHMLDGGIDEDIKTVADHELPVPINERIEKSDSENEIQSATEITLEADTEKFEQRKELIKSRVISQSAQKVQKTAQKTVQKTVPKNTATKKPAKKPAQTSARKNGLHYTSDPGFRIKERPSIEDIIKENK
jgi:putative ABC transport system ATP-binding protein